MKKTGKLLASAALLLALACGGGGGGSTGTPATKLDYSFAADPGDSWRLVKDPATTETKVVLDLLAPAGTVGNGFTVTLTTNSAEASWAQVDNTTSYAVQGPFATPLVNLAKVSGGTLHVVVGQALGTPVPYDGDKPLLKVVLDKASSAMVGGVTLTASAAGNLGTDPSPVAVTVSVGSLAAK